MKFCRIFIKNKEYIIKGFNLSREGIGFYLVFWGEINVPEKNKD